MTVEAWLFVAIGLSIVAVMMFGAWWYKKDNENLP